MRQFELPWSHKQINSVFIRDIVTSKMSNPSLSGNDTTYESNNSRCDYSINVSETDSDNDDDNNSVVSLQSDGSDATDDSDVIDRSHINHVVYNKKSNASKHQSNTTYKSTAADQSYAGGSTADASKMPSMSNTVDESNVDESNVDDNTDNESDISVVIQYDDSIKIEDLHDESDVVAQFDDSVKIEDLHGSSVKKPVKIEELHGSSDKKPVKIEDLRGPSVKKPVKTEALLDSSDDDSVKIEDLHDESDVVAQFDDSVKIEDLLGPSVKKPVKTEALLDSSDDDSAQIEVSHDSSDDDSVKIVDLNMSHASDKIFDVDSSTASSSTSRPPSVNKNAAIVNKPLSIVDDVQPVHTGKTGMATFNAQQSMAVELLQNICKSLEAKPGENDFADDTKGLKVELKPHQKHGLKWMSWRERQKPRGGILADDMGLGKTLSMISLIVKQKNDNEEELSDSSESDSDYSDYESKDKKLAWIAKGSSSKSHCGGTLVVCPATIMGQWEEEVKKFVSKNMLSVVLHHGSNRENMPRRLCKPDMVITTYGIVQSESDSNGVLFSIKWNRIILDEAHNIRNHTCKTSIACCKLRGVNRWALTGTPIQNKELDLYALLKFLRCRPFDDYSSFKMWISKTSSKSQERLNQVLQALLLRRTKEDLKKIGEMKLLPDKKTEIISVTLSTDEMNVYQKVMVYSQNLFAQFLQQRENRNSFAIATGDEHKLFAKLHQKVSQMHGSSNEIVSGHHILILILRLRQICIHPTLIDAMLTDEDYDDDSDSENLPEVDLLQQLSNLKIATESELDVKSQDENISKASSKVLMRSNPVFDDKRISSKFQKILDCILERVMPLGEKAVVVSQFTTVLNMFGGHLANKGIRYVMLTGETKIALRNDIKDKFNSSNTSVQVLLLSLNTGGVGLNLCGANHMFFIDPHWNPQLESQAQDRIYRMGQKKTVTIYKFLCDDTIERRIQHLQEKKLGIADQILTGAKRTASKLTIQDMKTLFEL